jgi:hypothetical protein
MQNFYIYYRVVPTAQALAAAGALLAHVERQSGINGRLMQRADDPATWMEVYEGVADLDGFRTALAAAEAASGIAGCLAPGARRVCERFVPVAGINE